MLMFSIYHFRARRCGDWNLLSGEHSRGHETRPAVSPPDDLTTLLDLLQSAPEGSPALDARIETVLFRLASDGLEAGDPHTRHALGDESASGPGASAVRWSEDLMLGCGSSRAITIIPSENATVWCGPGFSPTTIGRRGLTKCATIIRGGAG
jgi:hypothetical protein